MKKILVLAGLILAISNVSFSKGNILKNELPKSEKEFFENSRQSDENEDLNENINSNSQNENREAPKFLIKRIYLRNTTKSEKPLVNPKKIKNINDLKNGDTLIIPNDPTNGGRALILLDKAGIIKLKDNKNLSATTADIAQNPKNLKIITMSNEQIAPRLDEVAGAIINSNFAIDAKVTKNEIILIEGKDSPYVNVVTVLKENQNDERVKKLVKALQSEKVKKYIEEKYDGRVIPAF